MTTKAWWSPSSNCTHTLQADSPCTAAASTLQETLLSRCLFWTLKKRSDLAPRLQPPDETDAESFFVSGEQKEGETSNWLEGNPSSPRSVCVEISVRTVEKLSTGMTQHGGMYQRMWPAPSRLLLPSPPPSPPSPPTVSPQWAGPCAPSNYGSYFLRGGQIPVYGHEACVTEGPHDSVCRGWGVANTLLQVSLQLSPVNRQE